MDSNNKKKTQPNRQWRFTQKQTPPSNLQGYKSVSPKYAVGEYHQYRHSTKINNPQDSREIYDRNTAEIERLVEQLNNNRNRYHTMVGEQTVKSLEHIERSLTPLHGQENQEALKSIIIAGQQYRKELLKAQQKKPKVGVQSPSSRRQQNLFRQNQSLKSDIMLLKSQKSLLEKELMIIRDNSDRIKRKYELQLYDSNTELQQLRKKVIQLESHNIELVNKTEKLRALEMTVNDYQILLKRNNGDYDKIRHQNHLLRQKSDHFERMYQELFENYSKLEVACQSLQKQMNITKTYHANTQINLNQAREDNHILQQQRNKLAEEMNQTLNKKSNQIVMLTRKVQELGGLLQAREGNISEMELYSGEYSRKIQELATENNKLKHQIMTTSNKLSEAHNESIFYKQHISRLTQQIQKQSEELQKDQNIFQKIYKQYSAKEIQWSKTLKTHLSDLSNQYNIKFQELTNTIIDHENTIKTLEHELNQAEAQNKTLKSINFKLNGELVEYSQQIKEKMLIIHNNKLSIKELENNKIHGDKKYEQIKASLENYDHQMQGLKAELEDFKQRQQNLIKERELLTKMLTNKTNESESLKVKMIQIQQSLRESFKSNVVSLSSQHSKAVKELEDERQNLMQENMMKSGKLEQFLLTKHKSEEELKMLKIQSQQYQGQILQQALQIGSISDQIKRLGEIIVQKNKMIRQLEIEREDLSKINEQKSRYITQLKKQLILQEQQMKQTFNQNFQRQYSNHKSEVERKQKETESYKKEIEALKNANGFLQNQLESLRQRFNADYHQMMSENTILRNTNSNLSAQLSRTVAHYENSYRGQQNLLNSALSRERTSTELVQRTAMLERDFEEIENLVRKLQEERQILIKKYIALSNEILKIRGNSSLKNQTEALEAHFTNVSVLHTEINKKLTNSKLIFREVQKSKSSVALSGVRERSTSSRV